MRRRSDLAHSCGARMSRIFSICRQAANDPWLKLVDEVLQLGDGLLEPVQVAVVSGQVQEMGFGRANDSATGLVLVALELARDDDLARREEGRQHLGDVAVETVPLSGPSMSRDYGPPAAAYAFASTGGFSDLSLLKR